MTCVTHTPPMRYHSMRYHSPTRRAAMGGQARSYFWRSLVFGTFQQEPELRRRPGGILPACKNSLGARFVGLGNHHSLMRCWKVRVESGRVMVHARIFKGHPLFPFV